MSDHSEENGDNSSVGKKNHATVTTFISNPGITDRLNQDVPGFCKHGFQFELKSRQEGILRSFGDNPPIAVIISIDMPYGSLLSSIGPFLRALVRLCVDPINPRSLRVIVLCEKVDERTMAHGIHMLIRNSMGAALFLDLHVVLPIGLSKNSVQKKMQQNDDGCYEYPSVILHEYGENILEKTKPFQIDLALSKGSVPIVKRPLSRQCLEDFDATQQHISLKVTTRMCTVRLTPLLFHLANKLMGKTPLAVPVQQNLGKGGKLLVVCLEQISNLYRVLMLVRDHGGISAIHEQLVVVVKTNVEQFRSAAKKFVKTNFLDPSKDETDFSPQIFDINGASVLLKSISNPLVAADLHRDAITLGEQDADVLSRAGAIIWGFESDGVPSVIDNLVANYVQIRSRTSVNVVVAVSIVLHLAWTR